MWASSARSFREFQALKFAGWDSAPGAQPLASKAGTALESAKTGRCILAHRRELQQIRARKIRPLQRASPALKADWEHLFRICGAQSADAACLTWQT